jgi:hypothetical protein
MHDIKMHLRETVCESVRLNQLTWDRIHGRHFVDMVKGPQLLKEEFHAHMSHSHVRSKFTPWTLCILRGFVKILMLSVGVLLYFCYVNLFTCPNQLCIPPSFLSRGYCALKWSKCTGLFEMIVGVLTTCHTQYT